MRAMARVAEDRRSSYRMSWATNVASALDSIAEGTNHPARMDSSHLYVRGPEDSLHSTATEQKAPAVLKDRQPVPAHGRPLPPLPRSSWYTIPGSVDSDRDSTVPQILEVRFPPRRPRSVLSRISLTPSDVPYPAGLFTSDGAMDMAKAERVLGISKQPQPPMIDPAKPHSEVYTVNDLPAVPLDPLNGRTAWLHSLTGALIVFTCWGMALSFGLFQAYFETYYLPHGTSSSAISWIGSTQVALVFGLGAPVGRLVDRGYFRLVFHTGSVVMLVGIFCTAWCKTLWSLWLVMGLVTGLGMGMVFSAGIVALMGWFDEKRLGAAMGIGAAGSCVGGIVYIIIARHFLPTHGFPTTMRILGGVATAALIPPNLVFRVRGQHHRSRRGKADSTVDQRTFTNPAYLLAAVGMFCTFAGVYFGFVYMVLFASTQLKLSNTGSTNLLIFMLAANLPGRFLPALISDKCIGPLNTIIPSIFLSAGCIGLWMALGEGSNARGALTVVASFYGFVSAGIQVLYAPTVAAMCLEPAAEPGLPFSGNDAARAASDRMGLKTGVIFTCIGVASLIGTPIGGALIQYRVTRGMARPYLGAQIFAMCSLLLGGCLVLASRVVRVGWDARRA
ncbi:hypothetical protein LTR53_012014 [Teratosphaeriaceae sp. CCFEE 6253]|nr:hypothetical protein LTR53_012014 [Teratosphaeriaceae sp. CCFEE 6253]